MLDSLRKKQETLGFYFKEQKVMEAKELMIGDWVRVNDTEHAHSLQVAEILRKSGAYYAILYWDGMPDGVLPDRVICEVDKIEPIPLTHEILKKNGFRKSVSPPGIHAKCYEINNKDEKYCLTIANYNKYKRLLLNIDSEDSECFNIKCDYVHQLQHALKLCGVEKEIIL